MQAGERCSVKVRADFVTNSSSSHWLVKNISGTTKTMLDLLEEAADNNWEFMYWEYDEPYEGVPRGFPKGNPKRMQEFREKVAMTQTFLPHIEVEVVLECGNGGTGAAIYSIEGLIDGTTRSFEITYLFTAV